MNKYIKMFMDDHDLEVNEEFSLKEFSPDYHYFFSNDGKLKFKYNNDVYAYDSTDLARLLDGQLTIIKIKNKPWKPRVGDSYYFISNGSGNVHHTTMYEDNEWHRYTLSHNLVFQTQEEAEDYKWFLDKVDEYQRAFTHNQDNHFIYFDVDLGIVSIMNHNHSFIHGVVYFGDEENCTNFIKLVGEERIKKYMFYLWK